jgi:hypothetical protein
MVSPPDIIVRDRSNLDEYLYEPNSRYQSAEAKKVMILRIICSYSTMWISCSWMEMAGCCPGSENAKR